MMIKKFGIDISYWQRGINISRLKNEKVEFVIVRAMYGNSKDLMFEEFYNQIKSNNIPLGVYQYGLAKNVAQAREEAQALINYCLKNKTFEYPIYYDVEDKILLNLGINETTDIVKAWCETIENAGYFAGIYMNENTYNREVYGSVLSNLYSQWRAKWTVENNKPINVDMWQFGGETNLIRDNHIAGFVCDMDYSFVDFPTIIKNKGLNGYNKNKKINNKTIDELAVEVINGKWGNGQDRKISLTNAGYDYNKVQSKVNELINSKKSNIMYYKIVRGDTLSSIALKYKTTVTQLMNWNNIKNANLIYAGKSIRVR